MNKKRDIWVTGVCWAVLLLISPPLVPCSAGAKLAVEYSISVEKDVYAIGEPVAVTFTLTNKSSRSQKIQKWRGPLAGVTRGANEFDFAIYYLMDEDLQRIRYKGMFACGPPSYMILRPNVSWQRTYVINNLKSPAYLLDKAGKYVLRSTYFSHGNKDNRDALNGKIHADDIKIRVVRLNKTRLWKIRRKIAGGDPTAISIAAMHRDAKSIPLLSKLCSSEELETRKLTYIALGIIGTDHALHTLGKAVLSEPEYGQRIEITGIFADSGNVITIPYLKKLLQDNYTSVTRMGDKRYHQYTVRKWASEALNRLGVPDNTPYLEDFKTKIETMPEEQKTRLFSNAVSDNHALQLEAVRQLAISGYSALSAETLTKITCDPNVPETTRDYASMGVGNFVGDMPAEDKTSIREKLRRIMEEERLDTPNGIIRLLLRLGAGPFVYETLGEQLKGHTLEIDVLEHVDGDYTVSRLLQIYQDCPKGRKAEYYSKRASVGRTLIKKGDIRGMDILMELLRADTAPGPQYRNNVYCFLALRIGKNFGYEDGNYRPELEEAIPKMISWWEKNRSGFKLR